MVKKMTIDFSDLLKQIQETVQQTVQSEMKSMLSVFAKKPHKTSYLTGEEVCAQFKISPSTLHRRVNRGEIKCMKTGRKNLYDEKQIIESLIMSNSKNNFYGF
jgi:hypothetical protein